MHCTYFGLEVKKQKKHGRLKHFLKLHAEWGKDNKRQIGKAQHNDSGCCQYIVTSHIYNMIFGDFEWLPLKQRKQFWNYRLSGSDTQLAELVMQLCTLKCSHFAGNAIGRGISSIKDSFSVQNFKKKKNSRRGKNCCEIKYTGFFSLCVQWPRKEVIGGNGISTPQVKAFSMNASCWTLILVVFHD